MRKEREGTEVSHDAGPVPSPGGFEPEASELVFALVGYVGTDLDWVQNALSDCLINTGYTNPEKIRLSNFLAGFQHFEDNNKQINLVSTPEDDRILTHMKAGNALRRFMQRGDALALLGVEKIYLTRSSGRPPTACPTCSQLNIQHQIKRKAYILNSLKHPAEVHALRRMYGPGFYLIGVFQEDDDRKNRLAGLIASSMGITKASRKYPDCEKKAEELMEKDYFEPDEFGQRVRDTFHLADVFVPLAGDGRANRKDASHELKRFIELILGHPHIVPTPHEYLMFFAHTAAVRSGSLSRQVGAVVGSDRGDVVSVGCNEVPRAGGGQYLASDPNDARDCKRRRDSSEEEKENMIQELLTRLQPWLGKKQRTIEDTMLLLGDTRLMNLIEFGRCTHAEAEAIAAAVRKGTPIAGMNLYTTVFPCHDCAKLILTTGIKRVVYIEPYPKSLSLKLHDDAITTEGKPKNRKSKAPTKVRVEPFAGVGPRRFLDFFSLKMGTGTQKRRKDDNGYPIKWVAKGKNPRPPMLPNSYLDREVQAIQELKNIKERDRA